ncbi:MAG: c-type cytochrome [Planctomycetota bacterium]
MTDERWEEVTKVDVTSSLEVGTNRFEIIAGNDGGPAGLALRLTVDGKGALVSDGAWQASTVGRHQVASVEVLGPVGGDVVWTGVVDLAHFGIRDDREAPPQAPERAVDLHLPEGFEAELIYRVPKETQGSWVSLAVGEDGELYASDQGRQGIYRVKPAPLDDPDGVTTAERIGVDVSGAQGMCWAFGSLYANVYGQGVWRMRDTDGDGELDHAENLVKLGAGGEHGPHAILPTPDGEGLYFIGGNHVKPPAFDRARAPSNWREDLLLPRLWDARGHARGKLAPGGWIARCDPDGKNVEILSTGYRNQYDIALDRSGEMFTYDADMEWDLGSPWYRPTRLVHVTSGSEFGWRSGTGKWPTYYEDSLPPALEIGPGSPTGALFGTGAAFPARYQNALFLLDWTFGTIYAMHLEPRGATYAATKEEFAWAKPLAVTDAVIGADGAMYFAVGGRRTRSSLYRIVYRGGESTAPAPPIAETPRSAEARATRLALEAFHGRVDPAALDACWPHLASEDRFVRYAARIGVENQPVATWRDRALAEPRPRAAATALVALARQGAPEDLGRVVEGLERLDLAALPGPVRLTALRAYALAFTRLGPPGPELRTRVAATLDPLFPAQTDATNTELARILTYVGSDAVVEKTLALMARESAVTLPPWAELIQRNDQYGGPIAKMLADMPPLQDITYALILRNATEGWTLERRREYLAFFPRAAAHPGGMSYTGFLENIRADAVDLLPAGDRRSLAAVLGETLVAEVPVDVTPPAGPGRSWTLDEATRVVGTSLSGRSYAAGHNLFHATSCSTCHRFDGQGGAIGPDLTTVANKFSIEDLLEAIVDPDAAISDQYGSHLVLATDGEIAEGILVEEEDAIVVYPRDVEEDPWVFERSEIERIEESPTSQMPAGLIDALNPDELRDLVAFLLAGGDEKAKVFQD